MLLNWPRHHEESKMLMKVLTLLNALQGGDCLYLKIFIVVN